MDGRCPSSPARAQTRRKLKPRSALRSLAWEGLFNARDLGGLPTADGGQIRWGALVRSDLLPRLTPAGQAALLEHGVSTLVDVRFPDEVAHDWDAYPFQEVQRGARLPQYLNVPFNTGRNPEDELRRSTLAYAAAESREELNRLDIDLNERGLAAIMTAIAAHRTAASWSTATPARTAPVRSWPAAFARRRAR